MDTHFISLKKKAWRGGSEKKAYSAMLSQHDSTYKITPNLT